MGNVKHAQLIKRKEIFAAHIKRNVTHSQTFVLFDFVLLGLRSKDGN